MVGVSTGANVAVAQRYTDRFACDVLTICFDSGERYLSVEGLFDGNEFAGSLHNKVHGDANTLLELSE